MFTITHTIRKQHIDLISNHQWSLEYAEFMLRPPFARTVFRFLGTIQAALMVDIKALNDRLKPSLYRVHSVGIQVDDVGVHQVLTETWYGGNRHC